MSFVTCPFSNNPKLSKCGKKYNSDVIRVIAYGPEKWNFQGTRCKYEASYAATRILDQRAYIRIYVGRQLRRTKCHISFGHNKTQSHYHISEAQRAFFVLRRLRSSLSTWTVENTVGIHSARRRKLRGNALNVQIERLHYDYLNGAGNLFPFNQALCFDGRNSLIPFTTCAFLSSIRLPSGKVMVGLTRTGTPNTYNKMDRPTFGGKIPRRWNKRVREIAVAFFVLLL